MSKAILSCLILISITTKGAVDSVNYFLENGQTPLIEAISSNDISRVKMLIKSGADPNLAEQEGLRGTPLMYATSTQNLEMCTILIDAGANVNAVDVNNDPAINWATYYGYVEIMNYLIANDADLSITSKHGKSVDVGLRLWHADTVMEVFRNTSFFERRSAKEKKLIEAVQSNEQQSVNNLLQNGVSPNTADGLGTPILQLAAQKGYLKIIESLFNNGADLNKLNRVGQCALAFAARFGHLEVVDYLLSVGADVNITGDSYKLTPLMGAAVGGNVAIGKALLKSGAKINAQDVVNQCGALHWAMFYGNTDFIKLLVQEGADYKMEVLEKRYTGYSLAKAYGYDEVAELMTAIETSKNKMLGSWKITRIAYIYSDTTYVLDQPFPGRLLVTPWRYSIIYNPWTTARTPFDILSKPTDDEIKMAFQTLVFNTGTYKTKDGVFITTADIAKVPGFEGGKQYYEYSIDGDQLIYKMVDETYPDGTKPEWFGKLKVAFTMTKE